MQRIEESIEKLRIIPLNSKNKIKTNFDIIVGNEGLSIGFFI